jgi:hypothetical protein
MKAYAYLLFVLMGPAIFGPANLPAQTPALSRISYQQIASASFSGTPIDGSNNSANRLKTGTLVFYRTNQGRLGAFEVLEYGYHLRLAFKTFASPNSIFRKGNSLLIRGTYSCDLDYGKETSVQADFFWRQIDKVQRRLVPKNGATFALYVPSQSPGLSISYPNGGEKWVVGQTYTLRWKSNGLSGPVTLKLKRKTASGRGGWYLISEQAPNTGSFRYRVPQNMPTGNERYRLYIAASRNEQLNDYSNGYLTLTRNGIVRPSGPSPAFQKADLLAQKAYRVKQSIQGTKVQSIAGMNHKLDQFSVEIRAVSQQVRDIHNNSNAISPAEVKGTLAQLEQTERELMGAQQALLRNACQMADLMNTPTGSPNIGDLAGAHAAAGGQQGVDEEAIRALEAQMEKTRQEREQSGLALQEAIEKQSRMVQMMSNIMKEIHDTQTAIIRNLR